MSNSNEIKKLLDFSTSDDLEELETIIGEFNPFNILGVADTEIRHSNVLAWLLNPNAHHGLGDSLFKNILLDILKDNMNDDFPSVESIIGESFTDLIIKREWRNIDLLAVSERTKLILVIENKIYAGEQKEQLKTYVNKVNEIYPSKCKGKNNADGYSKVFIYLTLDGSDPSDDTYIPYRHENIYKTIKSVARIHKGYINAKVYDFIQQYLKILEEKLMPGDELQRICNKLYRDHKEAIDMILAHGKPSYPAEEMKVFHTRTETESIFEKENKVNKYYYFVPKDWTEDVVPRESLYSGKYLVAYQLSFEKFEEYEIKLCLYVSNFKDAALRKRFMETLKEAFKDVTIKKLRQIKSEHQTSTTLITYTISLKDKGINDLDDKESIKSITNLLVDAYNDDNMKKAREIVDGVVKKFNWNA